MLQFSLPWILLLVLLPLLTPFVLPKRKSNQSAALKVPFFQFLMETFGDRSAATRKKSIIQRLLAYLCWILLVIAASGPAIVSKPIAIPSQGRSIMMAIDLSGSMRENDMVVNGRAYSRFDVVKAIATQFINDRQGDRIGLILFGSKAYLRSPMTPDVDVVAKLLNNAVPGLAGEKTAIGDSIGLAVKKLIQTPKQNRVLILMTDGRNTAGNVSPIKAAHMAAQSNIRIYTIGLGTSKQNIWAQNNGPDNKTLKEIADIAKGKFFYAGNAEQLQQAYKALDRLEATKDEAQYYRTKTQLYPYPLALALFITFLMALLPMIGKGLRKLFQR